MSTNKEITQATSIEGDETWNPNLHIISDKTGIEREKQIEQTIGRVLISAIKRTLAHDEG